MDPDDEDDAPYPEFLVNGHLWLIAPIPRPEGTLEVCRSVVRIEVELRGGSTAKCVPVFTDSDLAYRFIEKSSNNSQTWKPFSCPTVEEFAVVLLTLLGIGDTHLGFDLERTHVRRIPIPRVLEGIKNRRR